MQILGKSLILASLIASCLAARADPLGKVLDLLSELSAKVTKEGEVEAAAYKEFLDWCDNANRDAKNAITTATSRKGKLEAKISELSGDIEASTSKIEDLASATAASGGELKNATAIREKEANDFAASEKELMEVIDALDRALSILEREMSKNPAASFAQVDTASTRSLLMSLGAVVEAAGISVQDRNRLLALVQSQDEETDDEPGAPAAAVYKSHSKNILDVLEDLKAKAEAQLSDLRKAESTAKHNYDLLKQSLEAQSAADTKDMDEEKASKAEAEEAKADAEGGLSLTSGKLSNAEESLATTQANCMRTAADHEATVKARAEELKVIAEAISILKSTTSGAVGQTYSLLQSGQRMQTRSDLAGSEVLALVRKLAHEHHSTALAQLASQVAAVMKYGTANGEDPFAKVKGLVRQLIDALQAEAHAEAAEKAFCDEEMAKTESNKGELDDTIAKLTVKIDQASAHSADLKEEVKELELELAALAKLQAEMDSIRQETHADYVQAKADLELGVTGVRKALGVLRDYYAAGASMLQEHVGFRQPEVPQHAKAEGAGQSIIGILEVVESDFATNLAKEETEEEDAQTEYDKVTQENKVSKALKEKDVQYKEQEIKQLSKSLAELSADREGASAELSAVLEYYTKIKERCIAKPETYEKRQERRAAEIKGLKEALDILENEAALLQRKKRSHMRGALAPR